ncbi:transcription antitermination factor NusB [Desulfofustis glycolicus]|uniref:Transcription antitermination protein NusB n=1 Tax=Desulfofustis glycolicus DSM 9705 TaxID=1121409 RepID=A0A1M5W2E3_9BACT|nr:transcription antitermination factor NusB [Desulfofustis glycolicus]MCB2215080.1 transcription antitermination factor NusB [Desulfobulbaceae bacterium]SHH81759.1 NusB antitermination factor [Desulfofustis glycolicus DSM 9705]
MGTRRKAREAALQFLFQDDFARGLPDESERSVPERFEQFCGFYQISRKSRDYALELVQGILERRDQIDLAIRQHATNWRLERIAGTDRNLLRIGIYELLYVADVPAQVAINEAVEIAKRFGSDESPSFVNGVLDAVRQDLPEPLP